MNEEKLCFKLKKLTNADDAFCYMSGEYASRGNKFCEFSILEDISFPNYVFTNALYLIKDGITEEHKELGLDLNFDKDGFVTPCLLGFPFMLWSKKLKAFYCFHFDTDLDDTSDEVFWENYKQLIEAYDFRSIVKDVKQVLNEFNEMRIAIDDKVGFRKLLLDEPEIFYNGKGL